MTSSIPVLKLENLSVEYFRRGKIIPAVSDVSFSIGPGETVGLVGESGSGKSTIALSILRLIRPREGRISAGRILFGEENLLEMPEPQLRSIRGRRIAMIFQDPFTSLNPVMTIREQMQEVIDAHRPESRPSLVEMLDQVQLDPSRTLASFPHQLSGGQRQRVAIATALLLKPELILADEPTTALDVRVQKDILDLIGRLQEERQFSMLFITHNLPLISSRADRVLVMEAGRLVPEGEGAWDRLRQAVKTLYG